MLCLLLHIAMIMYHDTSQLIEDLVFTHTSRKRIHNDKDSIQSQHKKLGDHILLAL